MLDVWTPREFVSVSTTYAVSPGLRDRMLTALHAIVRDMCVNRSAVFEMIHPDYEVELPRLVQLEIEAIGPGLPGSGNPMDDVGVAGVSSGREA
jgi:hypothetical protein